MSRTDKFFRMVLCSHEGVEAGSEDAPTDWVVSAVYKCARNGDNSSTLTASNMNSLEVLTFPQDSDKIMAVLPQEFWPRFITDLVLSKPCELQDSMI